jgi:hypothetical protein
MRRGALVLLLVLLPSVADARETPKARLFVVAGAAAGGTGTRNAPFGRIADAVDAGRALAATHEVVIDVAPGAYATEPRPLALDYPVRIKGSTVLLRDADGIATGAVEDAAIIRGAPSGAPVILVTGHGVQIRGLALDGGGAGTAFAVDKSADFDLDAVHVSNVASGFIVSASTGRIRDSFAGPPLTTGAALNGGNESHPADVRFVRNRLVDHGSGGLALQGAADPILPREPFHTLTARVDGNVLSTSVAIMPAQGPSNPYGVRLNLVNDALTPTESAGWISARITGNVLSGNHRYPLLITGGQTRREPGRDWSGAYDLRFEGNLWLPGTGTESRVIITFTNSRMGIAPFWEELATAQEYIEGATYQIRHDGELDACLEPFSFDCHLDHPEVDPCDDRVLGNVLEIDRVELPHRTFIPDVCP